MTRPKAFDRDEAVKRAMAVFWEKGYEATSTEELLRAMGIGRQSMYDTFGDKHRLYIEALELYQTENGAALLERLRASASPLAALGDFLLALASETSKERARGCMSVNAISELAPADAQVAHVVGRGVRLCEAALERVVREAKSKGEIAASVDERTAARFLLATMNGLRVSSKSGTPPEVLRELATFALRGLRAS